MNNNNNTNKLLQDLSKRLGMSEDKIKSAVENGNMQEIVKNTDSESAEKINELLNNPAKRQQVLSSPQAQALLKLLSGE